LSRLKSWRLFTRVVGNSDSFAAANSESGRLEISRELGNRSRRFIWGHGFETARLWRFEITSEQAMAWLKVQWRYLEGAQVGAIDLNRPRAVP